MSNRFVSATALGRIARHIPVSYHVSAKCGFLTKNNKEFCELSDADMEQYKKYLKPCKCCCPKTARLITEEWPKPEVITIWHCSDGREFTSEVEALRYELAIFRNG
jgi:hypothetical protein